MGISHMWHVSNGLDNADLDETFKHTLLNYKHYL